MDHVFPFGRPAVAAAPAPRPAPLFILGAYPSALHIHWIPPAPHRPVGALAVDVEPHAFWNGADEEERVEAWKQRVGWVEDWGLPRPAGRLNGSSGAWVDTNVLGPLGLQRGDAWITDCLPHYCASAGGARRIADTYAPFAVAYGLPAAVLPEHPSESVIVRAAARELERLRAELRTASPGVVVTLGNAALRVLRQIVDGELPQRLRSDAETYGKPLPARFEGQAFEVLPLAHPAAPTRYQDAHARWQLTDAARVSASRAAARRG